MAARPRLLVLHDRLLEEVSVLCADSMKITRRARSQAAACGAGSGGSSGSGGTGGQSHLGGGTPPGSYVVTVSASASGVVHSSTVTLVVN